MALGAVLVDRARVLEATEISGERVEGTTKTSRAHGSWFRARLFLEGAPASVWQGRRAAVAGPQLLLGVRDLDGGDIDLNFDQKVEVSSKELGEKGSGTWYVTGDPQPLRKKRRVIGWLATVSRVRERERERVNP